MESDSQRIRRQLHCASTQDLVSNKQVTITASVEHGIGRPCSASKTRYLSSSPLSHLLPTADETCSFPNILALLQCAGEQDGAGGRGVVCLQGMSGRGYMRTQY